MNNLTSDHILLTGFPGFLGSELLLRSLQKSSDRFSCLVQGKFRPLAEQKLESWTGKHPEVRDRVRLIEGDITQAGLGITVSALKESMSRARRMFSVFAKGSPVFQDSTM